MIDGTKEKQKAQYAQVSTTVTPSTQIFEKQGTQCKSVSYATLKSNQRVIVWSTGGAAMSEPPQITATKIVIVPAES